MRKESKGEDCALGHGQLRVVAGTAACIGGNVCSNNCLCGRFWRQKHSVDVCLEHDVVRAENLPGSRACRGWWGAWGARENIHHATKLSLTDTDY